MSLKDLPTLAELDQTRRANVKPRPSLLVKAQKRRERMTAAQKLRADVRARDQHQCQSCHVPVFVTCANPLQRAEVHHIQFRSKGGADAMQNLITICAECHAKIHAHELDVIGTNATTVRFVKRKRGE